jgi:tripartite-type tricarboxylate transporter receptor subunit TctC
VRPIRRRSLRVAAGALVLSVLAPVAWAQSNYPARSVRVIVPFAPGGGTDIFARVTAQKLSERLGKQFYVENISGAGGNLGTAQAARATPDGYTVLFAFGSFVVNPNLFAKVLYDPVRDFEPVTLAVTTPTALVVNPAVPANTVAELVALIKANPGKYSFAHGGFGAQPHLTGEQFRLALALDLTQVPYSGAGPANASVVAGHTPVGFSSLAGAAPYINDGKLRALAVTSKARSQLLPDVPTMAEAGLANIVGDSWVGVLLPAGTPHDIVSLLHREIVEIIAQPDMKERLATLGYEPVASTPEEFAQVIKDELDTWGKVIRAAGIKLQ